VEAFARNQGIALPCDEKGSRKQLADGSGGPGTRLSLGREGYPWLQVVEFGHSGPKPPPSHPLFFALSMT